MNRGKNKKNAHEGHSAFYQKTLSVLKEQDVPALVGGAFALDSYTGVKRDTKDFDLFLRERDLERALDVLRAAGLEGGVEFPHWLAKVREGREAIDLIFRSGNGLSDVDDSWFERASPGQALGLDVLLCPPEEILWTKAFIMERERYDGADVAHLIRGCASRLDWDHLVALFGEHWRVLLSHLILFGFIYPSHRRFVPRRVLDSLLRKLELEEDQPPPEERICRGTLLSRAQYLVDVTDWSYQDARLWPEGKMTAGEIDHWTDAIDAPDD